MLKPQKAQSATGPISNSVFWFAGNFHWTYCFGKNWKAYTSGMPLNGAFQKGLIEKYVPNKIWVEII